MEQVFVTGHRNPDTDSIVSAMSYAALQNALGERGYTAARLGHLNDESKRILNRFGMTERRMKREKRLDAARRLLSLAFAFPLYLVIQFLSNYAQNMEQIGNAAADASSGASTAAETLRLLWSGTSPGFACIVIGFFAVICWLVNSGMDQEWRNTQ